MSEYFNKYGLMRMHKDIEVENGILFTAYHSLWGGKDAANYFKAINSCRDISSGHFGANPPDKPTRFSHDNMKGLYYLCFRYDKTMLKTLPTFRWNGKFNIHPNTWMVLLAAKHLWAKVLFKPFIYFMIWYSYLFSPPSDTSGRNLWVLCDALIGYNYSFDKNVVKESFQYYITNGWNWKNFDNPIYVLTLDGDVNV